MGVRTGLQRLATVIRWLAYGWIVLLTITLLVVVVAFGGPKSWLEFIGGFVLLVITPTGIALIIAYVLDGFGARGN